jgi:hypothetical protein
MLASNAITGQVQAQLKESGEFSGAKKFSEFFSWVS